jgi:hypothetical protein
VPVVVPEPVPVVASVAVPTPVVAETVAPVAPVEPVTVPEPVPVPADEWADLTTHLTDQPTADEEFAHLTEALL